MSQTSERGALAPPGDGYQIHAKQRAVLQSDARYKVAKWGRRTGKNVLGVIEVLEFARDPSQSEWGRDDPTAVPDSEPIEVWWVGPSYDQARKNGFEKLKAALPSQHIAEKSESAPYWIKLSNGVLVEFRTFDHPDTLQGSGIDGIVVDERDYMPDHVWTDDLDPMLLDYMGWALWISKPVKPNSLFQRWFDLGQSADYPNYFSSHATSADNPFIRENPADKQGTIPEYTYQQQYLAQLPDDSGEVFKNLNSTLFTSDYALHGRIEGKEQDVTGEVYRLVEDTTPPYTFGLDFARHQDYRVKLGIDGNGEICYYSRTQNEAWDTIEDDIVDVAETYAPSIVVPDAQRDNKIISDLYKRGLNVAPTKFTKQKKKALIEDLQTRVEGGEITAPDSPKLDQLRLEMRQIQREVTQGGYARYHAPDGMYDDSVDGFALAASKLDTVMARARQTERDGSDDDEASSGVTHL